MIFDTLFSQIYIKRAVAAGIDFFIEVSGGFLGAYFGAMIAALVIAWNEMGADASQKTVWAGMTVGFLFWGLTVSWFNRVLIQGVSRSTIGKKFMQLEIVSFGAPIDFRVMMIHWLTAGIYGELRVVSSLDSSGLAPVIPLKPNAADAEKANEKKAA
jgi:hypothetical protein